MSSPMEFIRVLNTEMDSSRVRRGREGPLCFHPALSATT